MRAGTLYQTSSFMSRAPQVPGQQADDDATANARIRTQVQHAVAHSSGYSKHAFKARPIDIGHLVTSPRRMKSTVCTTMLISSPAPVLLSASFTPYRSRRWTQSIYGAPTSTASEDLFPKWTRAALGVISAVQAILQTIACGRAASRL